MLIGANWAVKVIMELSFLLDKIIYKIAGWTYKIFYIMGSITLDADETVSAITSKIYTILLIFMVFVVAYNMLLYIINPDHIHASKDKDAPRGGVESLIKKIAMSLVVIVASPYFFDLLYEVQTHVVEYNVIGTIILGGSSTASDSTDGKSCTVSGINASGDALVADVFTSFLYPDNGMMANDCCNGNVSDEELNSDTIVGEYCTAYLAARETGSLKPFDDIKDQAQKDDDYQYMVLISTIAGGAMVVYFLGFCIYLGVRLFKLLALELIAPIPALLDLIPGKSGTLNNWFKTVMTIWAQIFVYQAIVFSLVWLATLIPGLLYEINASINANASGATGGFLLLAKVLMIMALFQACREVPAMIRDVLGIKGDGGILQAAGLRGIGLLATAASAPGQLIRGVTTGYRGHGGGAAGVLGGLTEGIRGGVGGLGRNLWGMRNAKSLADINNTRRNTNQHLLDAANNRASYRNAHGGTGWGAFTGRVSDLAHGAAERGRNYLGLQDNFDTRRGNAQRAYDILDGAHIDDRAGRLGELHQQRDDIQAQLNGVGERLVANHARIDAANDFCNTFNEYRYLRDLGPLSADQQRRFDELDNQLFDGAADRDAREAELETQFNQFSDDVSWEANQFVDEMNRRINEDGYTMTDNEKQRYDAYMEQIANNQLLRDTAELHRESDRLSAQYESVAADYEAQENTQINRNETSIRQAAIQIQDLASRDAEVRASLSEALDNVRLSDGTQIQNGLDFLSRVIDENGDVRRNNNGDVIYTDDNGIQHNINLRDVQNVVEGVRGLARDTNNDFTVQGTRRELHRNNRGENNNDGGNGGNNS